MHDLRATKPPLTRRPDFFQFWEETLAELSNVHLEVQCSDTSFGEELPVTAVSFRSLGGCELRGFLVKRPTKEGETAPLVVTSHGYNSQCDIRSKLRHVRAGAHLFCFDARGFGRSKDATATSEAGYILTGIDAPERSILRGAYCDYVRAAEVARTLLGDAVGGVAFQGSSFAGALAFVAQALTNSSDLLAVGVPTFGWHAGRRQLVLRGSGFEVNEYLAAHPTRAKTALQTLSYFDIMNFADLIRGPAIVGVGLSDAVVPAECVFAVINHLSTSAEVLEFPYSHSNRPEESLWSDFDARWMKLLHDLG